MRVCRCLIVVTAGLLSAATPSEQTSRKPPLALADSSQNSLDRAASERLGALVKRLDDRQFVVREAAEREIRTHGIAVIPLLKLHLASTPSPEARSRLKRLMRHFTTLPWQANLGEALLEAKRSNKGVLVFSTIGEPDGFA
jgi:hypothetical protein